jgi:Tfp pilus assembly protein PilE
MEGTHRMGITPGELLAAGLVASLLVVCVYPSYSQTVERVRQAEAKTNLGGVFVAEMAFFADNGRYSDFDEISFSMPSGANRYTYRAMKTSQVGHKVEPGPVQVLEA